MDARNVSQYKKYVNDLFSKHASSLGTADFDQLFDESYSFHEDLLTTLEKLVYPSWKNFLADNKLSPLHNEILIPENGRYAYKDNGEVRKEPMRNFLLNRVKQALSYTGTGVSKVTAVAGRAVAIGAIAVTAACPPLWIAAGILCGVSGLTTMSMSIARIVDKAKHGEKNPRNYAWAAADLSLSVASVALSFTGVGLAATVARGSIALNVVRGFKAVVTIGGGIVFKIVDNTIKIIRQPDKLVIPGLESQTTPEIQAMFSTLSPQYQMFVDQYILIRHKFKSGTLTISDYLEFNSMLLVEFNVLDWKLTSSLLQSDLVIPTCSLPRQPVSITLNSGEEISFKDQTERPHPKIRLLNEKSAELLDIICKFGCLISDLERRLL
ncbi:hypothetical protein Ciccas_011948 [Cichlidogyrus casuarinus]|uniref:DUF4781 domain-containing protein n=1 Tax=Cichlidogyrus casuarinus TaxID=1844966 RepID=A0ABD2PSU8_9PLAT